MPVLDTNFLIALKQEDAGAVELLRSLKGEVLIVPSVVAVEFLTPYGARAGTVLDELKHAFTLSHTNEAWVEVAAAFRHELRAAKRSIRVVDFWIATWARVYETFVVTRDARDFKALGVDARDW